MSLRQAIIHIALDNGAINSRVTEAEVLKRVISAVEARFTASDIQAANVELTTFSEDELDELCCGEAESIDVSDRCRQILSVAFNSL